MPAELIWSLAPARRAVPPPGALPRVDSDLQVHSKGASQCAKPVIYTELSSSNFAVAVLFPACRRSGALRLHTPAAVLQTAVHK